MRALFLAVVKRADCITNKLFKYSSRADTQRCAALFVFNGFLYLGVMIDQTLLNYSTHGNGSFFFSDKIL